MPYGLLSDTIDDDPRLLAAGRLLGREGYCRAMAVWIQAICHCRRHNTDGVLSRDAADWFRPSPKVVLDALGAFVTTGLVEPVEAGWRIRSWHNYYDPAPVIAERKGARRAKRRTKRAAHDAEPSRARPRARRATDTDTVRTPSDPDPEKTSTPTTTTGAAAGGGVDVASELEAEALWRGQWAAKYPDEPQQYRPIDLTRLRALGQQLGAVELAARIGRYLGNDGPSLASRHHPLRFFVQDVAEYAHDNASTGSFEDAV